jgi:hypothetical protein
MNGYTLTIREYDDGEYLWQVRDGDRIVTDDTADTASDAFAAAMAWIAARPAAATA